MRSQRQLVVRRLARAAHAAHERAHQPRGAGARERTLPEAERARMLGDVTGQLDELSGLVGDLVDLARDGERPSEPLEDVRLDLLVSEAVERARRPAPRARDPGWTRPRRSCRARRARLDRAVSQPARQRREVEPARASRSRSPCATARWSCATTARGSPARTCRACSTASTAPASARGLPGSGLGLAIVRQVAEAHGGSVTAANADGRRGAAALTLRSGAAVLASS